MILLFSHPPCEPEIYRSGLLPEALRFSETSINVYRQHSVSSQNILTFMDTAVRTCNITDFMLSTRTRDRNSHSSGLRFVTVYSDWLFTSVSTIHLSLAVRNTTDSPLLLPTSLTQYKIIGHGFVFLLSHTTFDIGIPTYRPVWSDVVRAGGASHGLIDAWRLLRQVLPGSPTRGITAKTLVFGKIQAHWAIRTATNRGRTLQVQDFNLRPSTPILQIYILIECRHCFTVRMFTTIYQL